MTDQRSSWFQRLMGGDANASLRPLEEQLARAKEVAQQLGEALEQEREKVVDRDQRLQQAEARAQAAEKDFSVRLSELRSSFEERLEASKSLAQEHEKALAELEAARALQRRSTEEKSKLSASLSRQRDEAAKLTKSLAAASAEAQAAKASADELQRSSEALRKELEGAKRRLQAVETRASTVEHELAQSKQAEQTAEATASKLAALTEQHTDLQGKLTRIEAELTSESAHLRVARHQRDLALTMVSDLWRALEGSVGGAASLALAEGIDPGKVERAASLADAATALKRSLEDRSLCRGIEVEAQDDGMTVELRTLQLPRHPAASQWLMASAARFLEKAAGLDLAIDGSAVDRDTLRFRVRMSQGPRALS